MNNWHPSSWQEKPCEQCVPYPDSSAVNVVNEQLSRLPPLVTPFEINNLQQLLADAAAGKCFVLQGGDCAESFADCCSEKIANHLRILLQMSVILIHGLQKPMVRIGRLAGQYTKPRSQAVETQNGITLPSYRGDLINGVEFTEQSRQPNPQRMLQGYHYAAVTLNYVRALVNGGFADLSHPQLWDLNFARHSPLAADYQKIVEHIRSALTFIQSVGADSETFKRVEFYTSHEALHLLYEQALTRQHNGLWYNLSTHFPWVGMRTAALDQAHLEYLRGIANPIAVKIGPAATADWLIQIAKLLNPHNQAGRLTFITRLGCQKVEQLLPALITTVQAHKISALWSCDPMHGNTITTDAGYKTRRFDDILAELKQTFAIHRQHGSHLGGVHLELTGENVTECVGGARGLNETDLQRAYKSLVDPRLNYEQALEIAMLIVRSQAA